MTTEELFCQRLNQKMAEKELSQQLARVLGVSVDWLLCSLRKGAGGERDGPGARRVQDTQDHLRPLRPQTVRNPVCGGAPAEKGERRKKRK